MRKFLRKYNNLHNDVYKLYMKSCINENNIKGFTYLFTCICITFYVLYL